MERGWQAGAIHERPRVVYQFKSFFHPDFRARFKVIKAKSLFRLRPLCPTFAHMRGPQYRPRSTRTIAPYFDAVMWIARDEH
jgi:hypothetical protein